MRCTGHRQAAGCIAATGHREVGCIAAVYHTGMRSYLASAVVLLAFPLVA